jgi:hypothetical protein
VGNGKGGIIFLELHGALKGSGLPLPSCPRGEGAAACRMLLAASNKEANSAGLRLKELYGLA